MDVPLLDLKPQYQAIKSDVDRALQRVVESQYFILGPEVEAFEAEMAEYLQVPHAIGCASGTDALLLPLKALDPPPGDEVILPAFTFFATAGAVWNAGFKPVFCDIDPATFNVTVETLDAVWTERTRAAIPVHLFGQMAPMGPICAWARERDVMILEDAAQAIGARQVEPGSTKRDAEADAGTMAGAAGDAGAFSFFPTKNLGGFGDGGLVSTRDPELAERVAKLRVHGGRQMYHHEMVGTNSRLDALQAAVLRTKLPHLDGWTRARRENAAYYDEVLEGVDGVQVPETLEGNVHVYNQYTLRVEGRDELREHLQGKGIGTGVYYPVPLHLQACFAELGGREGQLPHAEAACREVLSLPVFPELGADRRERVGSAIRAFFQG
jgi:dTDP-4-amino-4,6-dideoxygalactose transaminase